MPRKYARGRKAWFICARCGQRGLYIDSKFDGYYPNLRVHAECWEDRHPQEQLKKVSDPIALWRPSPEWGGEPPVLDGYVVDPDAPTNVLPTATTSPDGVFQDIIWTSADFSISGSPVNRYEIWGLDSITYESAFQFSDQDAITPALIVSLGYLVGSVVQPFGGTIDDDSANNLGRQYVYFARAIADDDEELDSNTTFSQAPS